jgi:hypothetical protein
LAKQKTTHHTDKCEILAEIWVDYKNNEDFEDFVSYNDLGLPLAYAIAYGIVETSDLAQKYIGETFDVLLGIYGLKDSGFESLEDIFNRANENLNLKADSED